MRTQTAAARRKLPPLDLRGVRLTGGNLSKTDLAGFGFRNTDLTRVDLHGSNLEDARFDGAVMVGIDLSGVRNLSAVQLASAVVDETTILPDYLSLDDIRAACEQRH